MDGLLHTLVTSCLIKAGDSRRSIRSKGLACSEVSVNVSTDSLHSYTRMFTPAWTRMEIPQGRQVTMFLAYSKASVKISNNSPHFFFVLLCRKYFHYVNQSWKRITDAPTGDKSLMRHAIVYESVSKAPHILNLGTRWIWEVRLTLPSPVHVERTTSFHWRGAWLYFITD
jgi:hypothetical protein